MFASLLDFLLQEFLSNCVFTRVEAGGSGAVGVLDGVSGLVLLLAWWSVSVLMLALP